MDLCCCLFDSLFLGQTRDTFVCWMVVLFLSIYHGRVVMWGAVLLSDGENVDPISLSFILISFDS